MTNVQVECNAIKKLMTDKDPELLVRLDVSLFGNEELSKLFILIKKFYLDTSTFVGWDVLRAEVAKRCKTVDKAAYLVSLLEQIQERDIAGLTDEMLISDMRSTGKCRKVLDCVEDITKAAEEKDEEQVVALFRQAYDDIFVEYEYELEDCDMTTMSGEQPNFNFNKTGIEPLDERGGLIEGGVTIIGGESGEGKSTLAMQFARYSYDVEEESVAYFSYEQSKQELRARVLSAISGVDLGRIVCDDLTPDERLRLRVAESTFLLKKHYTDIADFCNTNASLGDLEFSDLLYKTYEKRDNRMLLIDEAADYDGLFVKMELLRSTKGVRFFVCDYPYLVPRGNTDRHLQNWEYNLLQSKKFKQFARKPSCKARVVLPAQFDQKEDSLKYVKGLINDADLFIALTADQDDKALNQVNASYKKYRNFRSIPGKPQLEDFKLQKEFDRSRFRYMAF